MNEIHDRVKSGKADKSEENGIDEKTASLDEALDFCIEMETGTGKTLVYLKTAYELYRQYAFTKFIILVPSVAIKEGVLSTLDVFKRQLADKKTLRESEVYKIKCALKHFDALGVDAHVNYDAPVKEYSVFKTRANGVTHT